MPTGSSSKSLAASSVWQHNWPQVAYLEPTVVAGSVCYQLREPGSPTA